MRVGLGDWLQRGVKEYFWMIKLFYILFVVTVSWLYTLGNTNALNLKRVYFILYTLCLKKTG